MGAQGCQYIALQRLSSIDFIRGCANILGIASKEEDTMTVATLNKGGGVI